MFLHFVYAQLGLYDVVDYNKPQNQQYHKSHGKCIEIPFDEGLDLWAEGIDQAAYKEKSS